MLCQLLEELAKYVEMGPAHNFAARVALPGLVTAGSKGWYEERKSKFFIALIRIRTAAPPISVPVATVWTLKVIGTHLLCFSVRYNCEMDTVRA